MGGRYKFIGQVIYDRELGIVFMDVNNINPVQVRPCNQVNSAFHQFEIDVQNSQRIL